MKVIFFGTPDFAVPSLTALYDNGYQIQAVVCQPDKHRNRGVISFCPIKEKAIQLGIDVLQFQKIREQGYEILSKLNPDIIITCAYGQIISQQILDIPKYGVINVHGSLLPKYRGSSPIQWAIANGETQTGITIMKTSLGVDCGDILLQKIMPIKHKTTSGQLFESLANLGATALIEGVNLIKSGKACFYPQDHKIATHFPMLRKEDGKIDWNKDANSILHMVLAFDPWPSSYTIYNGKILKIWDCDVINSHDPNAKILQNYEEIIIKMQDFIVGTTLSYGNNIFVKCGNQSILKLNELQLEGKKRMDSHSFLLGNKLENGLVLGE